MLAITGLLAISALSTTLAIARTRSFEIERRSAEALRIEAAKLAAERGLTLIERREGASGLLWLAKALERDPEDKGGLRHAVGVAFARAEREQVARLRANLVHKTLNDVSGLTDPVEIAAFRDRMAAIGANTPYVNAIAYHPEGRLALTGHFDGTVRPWDLAIGKADGKLWNVGGRITKLFFLEGGRKVLTVAIVAPGATRVREVRLWDLATRKAIGLPRSVDGIILAIRPDGRALAVRDEVNGELGSTIRVIDLETSAPLGPPLPHPYEVSAVSFHPDGRTLLTGDTPTRQHGKARARLWDVASGRKLWETVEHGGWHIYDVEFSPDGKLVATGGQENFLRLWDAVDGHAVGLPMEHKTPVHRVAFSPDGRTIAAGTGLWTAGLQGRAEVRLWDRALLTLGAAEYRAGRFDEAIRHLEESRKAYDFKPINISSIYLALAYHRKGNLASWPPLESYWNDSPLPSMIEFRPISWTNRSSRSSHENCSRSGPRPVSSRRSFSIPSLPSLPNRPRRPRSPNRASPRNDRDPNHLCHSHCGMSSDSGWSHGGGAL